MGNSESSTQNRRWSVISFRSSRKHSRRSSTEHSNDESSLRKTSNQCDKIITSRHSDFTDEINVSNENDAFSDDEIGDNSPNLLQNEVSDYENMSGSDGILMLTNDQVTTNIVISLTQDCCKEKLSDDPLSNDGTLHEMRIAKWQIVDLVPIHQNVLSDDIKYEIGDNTPTSRTYNPFQCSLPTNETIVSDDAKSVSDGIIPNTRTIYQSNGLFPTNKTIVSDDAKSVSDGIIPNTRTIYQSNGLFPTNETIVSDDAKSISDGIIPNTRTIYQSNGLFPTNETIVSDDAKSVSDGINTRTIYQSQSFLPTQQNIVSDNSKSEIDKNTPTSRTTKKSNNNSLAESQTIVSDDTEFANNEDTSISEQSESSPPENHTKFSDDLMRVNETSRTIASIEVSTSPSFLDDSTPKNDESSYDSKSCSQTVSDESVNNDRRLQLYTPLPHMTISPIISSGFVNFGPLLYQPILPEDLFPTPRFFHVGSPLHLHSNKIFVLVNDEITLLRIIEYSDVTTMAILHEIPALIRWSRSRDQLTPKTVKNPVRHKEMSTLAQQLWTRVADRARRASGGDAAGQRLLEDLNQAGSDDEARLLSRWEPELCISMLRVPTPINHAALRKLLARATREWTVEFVERGGLAVLLEALERLGGPGTDPGGGMERAMSQLRVVECIREVMNCKEGLSFLLDNGEQVHQLVNGLDSQNTTVKMQVFELLCALCMYSTRGHTVALDALFVFATARGHRYRFSPLVSELRTSQSDHYSTTILAFVNCIVQGADSLEARVRLRNELLGVGLGEELSKLRRDPCDELCVQLEAFDDNRKDDEEQLTTTQELLELSQFQIFQTLQEKLADTPHALSLQTVLLNLAQVDHNNDVMWTLLEDVTSRALDGSLLSTQRRVSKMHTKTRNASVQTPRPRGGRRNATVRPRVKSEFTQTDTLEVMVTDGVSVSTAVQTETDSDSVSTQTESDWNCHGEPTENHKSSNPMDCTTSETVNSAPVNCNIPPPPPLPFNAVNGNVPTPPPLPINCNGLPTVNCNAPLTVKYNAPPPPPLPINCNGSPLPPLPTNCNGLPTKNCNTPPPPPLPITCNGPLPPPLPNCNIPPPPQMNCNIPPPPPMNCNGPPPPPPMNCNGPPPPPPMNCNGPPPPPPMNSMGPPPPPMQSAEEYFASPTRHSLPSLLPSQWSPDDSPLVRYNSLPHPKKRMKTLNWTKIPPNKNFANTVWKDSSRPHPMPIDMKQIEELFCQRSSNQSAKQSNAAPTATPKSSSCETATLNVLDSKRSLGVNIMLRQFKDLGVDGLLEVIRQGRGDKLGADKLRGLLRLLPEQDEISLIRTQVQQQKQLEQNGGAPARLGDAENFYLRLSEVPSYALRVRAMLQREEFGPSADELRPQLATVLSACETLVSNASLREFLTLILQLGNLLNAGSYAGNAVGFRLSTLPRLLETRANKPRMTFLHFAVDVAAAQPSCLAFLSELGLVQEAAKLSLESIQEEVRTLVSGLKKLQEQMERIKNPEISAQFDDFLSKAEAEVGDLETKLSQLDEASARLARHFCEDEAKFQLTECLSLISDFISKTQLAIKENEQRRVQEARLAKQQMAAAAARAVHSVGVKRSRRGRGSTDSSDGEETCVVDKLMKEIRSGTFKLRRCAPA